jgi:L-ascorbate metabolism protein UlaG (beta-lactamase superfamily)
MALTLPARRDKGQLTIRWLGQAGFLLSGGGLRVLVDPWLSEHALRVRSAPSIASLPDDVSWLLATHEHGDHLDLPALPSILDRFPNLVVVLPEPLRPLVEAADARARVHGVQPGDRVDLGGAILHVVHAWHGIEVRDAYSQGHALRPDGKTPFVGYVVAFPGVTVYHSGDTIAGAGLVEELRPLKVDVALLPANGRDVQRERAGIVGNLDGREAAELAAAIGARVLIPMHHDMVRGNRVRIGPVVEAARQAHPSIAVLTPAISSDLTIGQPG